MTVQFLERKQRNVRKNNLTKKVGNQTLLHKKQELNTKNIFKMYWKFLFKDYQGFLNRKYRKTLIRKRSDKAQISRTTTKSKFEQKYKLPVEPVRRCLKKHSKLKKKLMFRKN